MTDTRSPEGTPATRTLIRDGRAVARRIRTYRLDVIDPTSPPIAPVTVTTPVFRIGSRPGSDLVLRDETVSRLHCEIVIDEHGHRLRDLGSTNGTVVDGVRAIDVYLRPGARVRVGRIELVFVPQGEEAEIALSAGDRFGPLVGRSVAMRELFAMLDKVAKTDATVLVEGESGTGKELIARAVHEGSPRAGGPLVVFDCASVPSNLLESELFGHEKGAFTGATEKRAGRMEEADGGTIFLDEIGELPLDMQPKLLRALEAREVRRVGGTKTFPVNVRIVAATNRDLAREVNRGAFREDLYYRLAVIRVTVPPLRDRRDDVPLLVEHFVRRALASDAARADRILSGMKDDNKKRLMAHPWPGNVRELRNVIERSLALSAGDPAGEIDLPTQRGQRVSAPGAKRDDGAPGAEAGAAPSGGAAAGAGAGAGASGALPGIDLDRGFVDQKQDVLERFEAAYLVGQLERNGGNISRAAAAAGIDRMYFKRLLKKYRE